MPNINNSIIDFNDFNAEPQLLRDIQDGKAIAFYSFAHLLLDTSGKPYTLPTGLYISGAYDTLQQLQSAFPTGNTNLYIVNADKYIYYWNGSAWTKGGTIDATYAFGVELQVPNTATNGTLTQEQFNQLSNNENAYILFNNERYLLMDKGHEADTWGYSHLGADITGAKIKVITINTSNRSWVLTDEEFVKDGTISTQKIQDGAVTTQKLSSDVSLQIRKNDFASRFNSNRLDILEAQINADKNTIEYTSDKALEITCNGANIIDCNAHFKKVEGQTRRYSLNLIPELENKTQNGVSTNYDSSTGILTINGTANDNSNIWWDFVDSLPKEKNYVLSVVKVGGTYSGIEGSNIVVREKEAPYAWIYQSSYSGGYQPRVAPSDIGDITVYFKNGDVFNNLQLKIAFYEGNYTEDELPPFQPYDNTLVNSKATFISSGRNLLKGESFSHENLSYDANNCTITMKTKDWTHYIFHKKTTLPKGTYTLLRNTTATINTIIGFEDGSTTQIGFHSNKHTVTFDEDKVINEVATNGNSIETYKFVILHGDVAYDDKYFEPYTKNISQYDIELGAYDYIENGNLIKQTSEMITLNGSEYWQYESSQDKANTKLYSYPIFEGLIKEQSIMSNSTLRENGYYWNGDTPCIGINNGGRFYMRLDKTSFPTVESVKQWLASNPITLVYKKSTPTITPIVVPNGIVSYKNGLTSQFIEGKYLPYKYTAKYVNGGAK